MCGFAVNIDTERARLQKKDVSALKKKNFFFFFFKFMKYTKSSGDSRIHLVSALMSGAFINCTVVIHLETRPDITAMADWA